MDSTLCKHYTKEFSIKDEPDMLTGKELKKKQVAVHVTCCNYRNAEILLSLLAR